MILRDVCKSSRDSFCGDWRNTDRQAAAMTAQVLDGLRGVVQRGLHVGGGDEVLGSTKHLQHVCLSVVGGQIRFGQPRFMPGFLHAVETAVNPLRDERERQKKT